MEQTIEFLRRIYGGFGHDGVFTIIHILKHEFDEETGEYTKRKRAKVRVFKYHLSEVENMDWTPHVEANHNKSDIYFGAALREPEFLSMPGSSRGGVEDCSLSTCLALDIDFKTPGAHESEKLPDGIDDIIPVVDAGPAPSIAIHSGYGVHLYWIYQNNVELSSKKEGKDYGKRRKAAHAPYMLSMKEHGWHCDPTWTPDRIWRLPGFSNWKIPTQPAEVEAMFGLEGDFEKHDLDELAPVRVTTPARDQQAPATFTPSASSVPKAQCVENLPRSLKAYAEKYYDDSLEAEQSEEPEDKLAAVDLRQKSDYIERLLAGESIEDKGNRDFALTKVCGIICFLTADIEEFSESDLKFIVDDLMRPSLEQWVDDSGDETDLVREMEKTVDKLTRIKAKDQDNQRAGLRDLARALKRTRSPLGSPLINPETEEEEEVSGEPGESDKDELIRCGLIIYDEYTYIWDWPNGRYYLKYAKNARYLKSIIRDCWPEDDASCPFKHSYINEEGNAVEHPPAYLERLYSRAAENSYYSYCVHQTCFDTEDRHLIINTAPYRYTKPVYNEDIDTWLKLLGGDNHYDVLCDWLAGLTHLDRPCAALYLNGPPGCGKSLFGIGAGQLWTDDVPLYEHIAQGFNEALLKSPMSLIDEGISQELKNASMVLRRLVAQGSHLVNVKKGPLLRLRSYLRFVIAANNGDVLLSGKEEKLSKNDARAMSERIIYVKIRDDRAREFFAENNKDNVLTEQWIKNGGFARHVLWLSTQRDLTGRGRFLVQGSSQDMTNKFIFQGDERNRVFEWIVQFCEAPARIQGKTAKGLYAADIGNGIVVLNTKMMKERFTEFSGQQGGDIEHSHLLRHIKAMSSRTSAVKVWTKGGSARYWVIPVELILLYASTHDIGDTDRIEEFAARDTDITRKILKHQEKDQDQEQAQEQDQGKE